MGAQRKYCARVIADADQCAGCVLLSARRTARGKLFPSPTVAGMAYRCRHIHCVRRVGADAAASRTASKFAGGKSDLWKLPIPDWLVAKQAGGAGRDHP